MELDTLIELFEDDNDAADEGFEAVEPKLNPNPFVHLLLRLQELVGLEHGTPVIAEHDQIWLCADVEKLAEIATPELIIELRRCGVFFDEGLSLFT